MSGRADMLFAAAWLLQARDALCVGVTEWNPGERARIESVAAEAIIAAARLMGLTVIDPADMPALRQFMQEHAARAGLRAYPTETPEPGYLGRFAEAAE